MPDMLSEIWANDIYRKLILSAAVLLVSIVLGRLLSLLVVARLPDESPLVYTVRRVTNYLVTLLAVLLIFGIWVQRAGDFSVALGILAAGLAFALQEVIGSIAGWVTIVTGQPFTIGDRIETGGIRGDVVDIGLLLEPRVFVRLTDNWIELGLVYPVDTDSRRTFRSEISQRILTEFAAAGISVASQTIAIVQFPSTGATGPSPTLTDRDV
jgi:small-conductance mechanosensitive channel